VDVVIRPEDLKIVRVEEGAFQGTVDAVIFKGVHYEIIVMVEDREYVIHSTRSAEVGAVVGMRVAPDHIHVMELGV
jgi:spermidine/putrescine transport system ATP-binding protein